MKNTMRKLLAYMLSFLMLISCMPTEALAEIIVESSKSTQPFATISTLDPSTAVATYHFFFNGQKWADDQRVKDKETLYEPDAPTKDGYKFVGWYTNEAGTGAAVDFKQPVAVEKTGDVNLYACFKQVYYVFFMDAAKGTENIRVFKTKECLAGQSVTTTDVKLPVDVKQEVVGWKDENGRTVGASYTIGNADAYLYPDIQSGHWITFEAEKDATYTARSLWRSAGRAWRPRPPRATVINSGRGSSMARTIPLARA